MMKIRGLKEWVGSWSRMIIILGVTVVLLENVFIRLEDLSYAAVVQTIVAIVIVAAALLVEPRYKDGSLLVCAVVMTIIAALPTGVDPMYMTLAVPYAVYLASADSSPQLRRLWLWWLLGGVTVALLHPIFYEGAAWDAGSEHWTGAVVRLLLTVGGAWTVVGFFWLLGRESRRKKESIDLLQQRAELAGVVERNRIAREMHDIVAHSLSGIMALADGSRYAAQNNPEVAVQALETISEESRRALTQMRGLLSVLRDDSDRSSTAAPGVAEIQMLIQEARNKGWDLEAEGISDIPADLPELLQFTLYRVCQELITNMLRHGKESRGELKVNSTPKQITITTTNPYEEDEHEPGYGLIGMKERVMIHGGSVETNNREGQYQVKVVLPL